MDGEPRFINQSKRQYLGDASVPLWFRFSYTFLGGRDFFSEFGLLDDIWYFLRKLRPITLVLGLYYTLIRAEHIDILSSLEKNK